MTLLDEYRILRQKTRTVSARLTILDQSFFIVDVLTGLCKGGNYNITNKSPVRRSCEISMLLKNKTLPSSDSPFWLNKRFKLEICVKDIKDEEIWFALGTYCILNINVSNNGNDCGISVNGGDLACELNGDVTGTLLVNQKIERGVPIHEAIRALMREWGYKNVLIETSPYTLPYEIEKDMGDSRWDLIEELTECYKNYESFFNVDGVFVFQRRSDLYYNQVMWDSRDDSLLIDISRKLDYANVKNKIVFYGRYDDKTGVQYSATLEIRDENYPNNPFTIEKLGEMNPRSLFESNDKYATNEQCAEYAEYLAYLHTNCADSAQISCVPLYFLDVNTLIYLYDEETKTDGKYAIDAIDCGLEHDSVMSIACHRVYDAI